MKSEKRNAVASPNSATAKKSTSKHRTGRVGSSARLGYKLNFWFCFVRRKNRAVTQCARAGPVREIAYAFLLDAVRPSRQAGLTFYDTFRRHYESERVWQHKWPQSPTSGVLCNLLDTDVNVRIEFVPKMYEYTFLKMYKVVCDKSENNRKNLRVMMTYSSSLRYITMMLRHETRGVTVCAMTERRDVPAYPACVTKSSNTTAVPWPARAPPPRHETRVQPARAYAVK
ncbi:hypothetical protein EVAR_6149_1 [Eumeta japonica]|uniref:Uncharacterized protein n=1 Tax=Eumeta variegata TaxID=151549 RepID=A0A4C1TE70_EUMVA|nr:hypothetical protein EVAR_6149_1 [Eumeta japonica]